MALAMSESAVRVLLALRRVARGRVVRHDARLFTQGGRGLLPEIAAQVPDLIAAGYLVVEPSTAGRGVLQVTTAGVGLLAELERARSRQLPWARPVLPLIEHPAPQPEQYADGAVHRHCPE